MRNYSGASRRSFLRRSVAAGTLAFGGAISGDLNRLHAKDNNNDQGGLSRGDIAILRFLAALESIESDFWLQYNELGGVQDSEVPGGSGSKLYTAKLVNLDGDMAQYIHDNTEDEFTHRDFLNAYLVSKGAAPVSLEQFRTLPGSTATGSSGALRITNLMQLTVDTSWWTRYRSRDNNPDLNHFVFPPAVPDLSKGQFPAIPRSDADLTPDDHIQAIANTAGFHFPTIEQGGNSLYPALAQKTNSSEVLRILLSIGPVETMHFQTWSDKAGNTPPLIDSTNGLTFPDLNSAPFGGEDFQTNLIMPEPCPFLDASLPRCSIIRPTAPEGAAMGVVNFLTAMGLFIGQPPAFADFMQDLAQAADSARRNNSGD